MTLTAIKNIVCFVLKRVYTYMNLQQRKICNECEGNKTTSFSFLSLVKLSNILSTHTHMSKRLDK